MAFQCRQNTGKPTALEGHRTGIPGVYTQKRIGISNIEQGMLKCEVFQRTSTLYLDVDRPV